MKTLLVLVLAAVLSGCADEPLTPATPGARPEYDIYRGGDGSSQEKAVVIKGMANEQAGVAAEYRWIQERFPGYSRKRQSLQTSGGKAYDVIEFRSSDGQIHTVYFDVTDFIGKL